MALKIIAIAAMDEERAIGRAGGIPWRLPEDMKRFQSLTSGHAVLMGRKTYESIPKRYRPLSDRRNVVVSRSPQKLQEEPGIEAWDSAESYVEGCQAGILKLPSDTLWVIGGEEIYKATMRYWTEVYLTVVKGVHGGDAFFPPFERDFELVSEEQREGFCYRSYKRKA